MLLNLPIPKSKSPATAESSSYPSLYSTSSSSAPSRIASAANLSIRLNVLLGHATHCRCLFADTPKASSGGPKNCPEGETESSYLSLL